MKKYILYFIFLSACTAVEDDRICLDWESREMIRKKCIPMYGALICADERKVEHRCVLYDIIEPVKEEENASEVQAK
jgi:hypothetical protein